jgi:hypothetical protein
MTTIETAATTSDAHLAELLVQHAEQCATIVQDTYFPVIERAVHADMSDGYVSGESAIHDGGIQTTLSLHWRTTTHDRIESGMRIIAERYFETAILAFAKRYTNR